MKSAGPRLVVQDPAPNERVVIKPGKRRDTVVEFIRSAKRSLLLSIFRCDDLEVLRALGEAAARGVRVEVLITGRAKGWGQRLGLLAACLERMGVAVRRFPKGIPKYHAKYIVADECSALIATLNFTRKCFRRTRDFILETHDSAVVADLIHLFRGDIRGVSEAGGAGCRRLIVSPDNARARVETLLGGARHSIRIMDHKLTDPGILAILHDRARNGVEVEIQSSDPSGERKPHGRLIVIDGSVAILGSLALSAKSLSGRREVAVVIERPGLVAKLNRQFDKSSRVEVLAAIKVA